MKKIDRNKMILLSSELEGDFYSCFNKEDSGTKPIIFINDQITDKFHVGAFPYGINGKVMPSDSIFWYDETYHKPYIWVPRNRNVMKDPLPHSTYNYSRSLIVSLEETKIGDADVYGVGLGGIAGMYAANTPRIDKVVAVHPPILAEPVLDTAMLAKYAKTYNKRLIVFALNVLTNRIDDFSFMKESIDGYRDMARRTKPNKIRVVGSSVVGVPGLPKLDAWLSDLLYEATGVGNDGVVLWDQDKIRKLGFLAINDEKPISHLKVLRSQEYNRDVYKKLLLKK